MVAAAVVLLAAHHLGVITLAVQALTGVLFPSAAIFVLLLCNDTGVLGPWVNPPWADPQRRQTILDAARIAERDASLMGATNHLLAVARAPSHVQ